MKNNSRKSIPLRILFVAISVTLITALGFTGSALSQTAKKPAANTHKVEYEKVGRNGINILVYTPHIDRASLWEICKYYKSREGNIVMVSFFDKKIGGSTDNYLMSDHWWATYNYNKNTNHEVLTFTGYGRKSWGKKLPTKPIIGGKTELKPKVEFGKPIMSMWTDVKLYYGPGTNKKYIGKIVCFKGNYVKVLYPSGNKEWKSRKAIIDLNGNWFVQKNDPALKVMKYMECFDSP